MKSFTAVVAALGAFIGATHAQGTNTTLPKCTALNYTAVPTQIASLNAVIDTAIQLDLLKEKLAAYDPLAISDNRLSAIPFSILGTEFALTPIIKSLNATGISSLVPRHVTVKNDTTLNISVDFNGSLSVDGSLTFEIAQLNHQWWQVCWTNILKPAECPPMTIDVGLGVGLVKPSLSLDLNTIIQMCPKTAPKGTCLDVTVSSISIAAITGNFDPLLQRIYRKATSASLDVLSVAVESVSRLEFNLPQTGELLQIIGQRLLSFTTTEINKKGSLYNDIIKIINSLGKTLVNRLIGEQLAPKFVGNCYNVGIGDN